MSELCPYYKPQEIKWFKLIGYYQIISGITGGVGLLWLLYQNFSSLVVIGVMIGLSFFLIYAGWQLMTRYLYGPTYIIQALQILNFVGLGVTYQLVIGLALGLGFDWIEDAQMVVNFRLSSVYTLSYKSVETDAIRVVVNFVPVGIINYLMNVQERAQERKRLVEYSSDGAK